MNFKPCLADTVRTSFLLLFTYNQLRFCLFVHCSLSLIKCREMLNNIDKGIKCVSLKNAKLKWVEMQNFRKIAKLRCREICEPQNREINVSRKFHVIRWNRNKVLHSPFKYLYFTGTLSIFWWHSLNNRQKQV